MITNKKSKGENPYPHKFDVSLSHKEFVDKFGLITKKGEWLKNEVSIAGRVHQIRSYNAKLKYYDLISDNIIIQIYFHQK